MSNGSERINEGASTSSGRRSNGSERINEGASTSSGIVSAEEAPFKAELLEIKEFGEIKPDRWIKCEKCLKWRFSRQYFEGREVPEDWECKMWISIDGQRGSCDMPGSTKEPEVEHEPYPEGEVVWAKLGRHDYWPGMVETYPGCGSSYTEDNAGLKKYNVTFFGVRPSHQWVFASKMRKFEKTVPPQSASKTLKLAIEQGNKAIDTPYTVRIVRYSISYPYSEEYNEAKINNGHVDDSCSDESKGDVEKGPSADAQEEMDDQDAQPELMQQRLPSSTDGKTEAFEEWQMMMDDNKDLINEPMPGTSKNVAQTDDEGFEELQNEHVHDKGNGDGSNDADEELSEEGLEYLANLDKLYPRIC